MMKITGRDEHVLFGFSMIVAGDLNGDQVPDYVIGDPSFDTGTVEDVGTVEAYSGATGLLLWQITGTDYWDQFGLELLAMEDRNGDGIPEILVSTNDEYTGEMQIFSGADGTFLEVLQLPVYAQGTARSMASIADLDGDGVSDCILGRSNADSNGLTGNGAVLVISGATLNVLWQQKGDIKHAALGSSVASVGDVNGDGFDEVLSGATGARPPGGYGSGSAFLYSGIDGQLLYRWDGDRPHQDFGSAVASAGDADGDGIPDCAVGAKSDAYGTGINQGSFSIYSGVDGRLLCKVYGQENSVLLGNSLATAGDVDLDGKDDLLVSSWEFKGRLHLYSGSSGIRLFTQEPERISGSSTAKLGSEIIGLGDFNGDGNLNYLTSDPGADSNGSIYLMSFAPFIHTDTQSFSAATGDLIRYELDFPAEWAISPDLSYALLASGSGSGPTLISGYGVPLTADFLFQETLAGHYPAFVQDGAGILDSEGKATVTLQIPPGAASPWIHQSIYLAAISFESAPGTHLVHGVSRAVSLTVLP